MKAAEFLAKAQRFSVKADISYDVIQDSGQKLEFGASRTITVKRPDRISVDIVDRDGTKRGFRFDGKQIAFFGLTDLFLVAIVVWDFATRGRIHSATLWGSAFVVMSQVLRLMMSGTEPWLAFAGWAVRLVN